LKIIDSLRHKYGATVAIVHHSGHGEETKARARGSSALKAALDWEYLLNKNKEILVCTKQKDFDQPESISYRLELVGDSAVIVFGDPVEGTGEESAARLTEGEHLLLDCLLETCEEQSQKWSGQEEWRSNYYEKTSDKNDEAQRKGFNRGRKALLEKGAVLEVESGRYAPA